MHLTPEQIADATGQDLTAIRATWPLVLDALAERGIDTRLVEAGVAATIAVECPPWAPIREWGALADLQATYGAYYGRGLIQLTWPANYTAAGAALGLDLLNNPDLALDPLVAARVLAWYVQTHGTAAYCEQRDWLNARRSVNGYVAVPNGWDAFKGDVDSLLPLATVTSVTTTRGGIMDYKQRHVSQYENWGDGGGLNGHMNCGEASWVRWLIAAQYPLFLALIAQGLTFVQAVGRLMAHVRLVSTAQAERTGEPGTLVVQMEHYAQACQIPGWRLAPAEQTLWGGGVVRPWTIFLVRAWQLAPAQYPESFLGSNLDLPDHYILKLPGRTDGPLFNDPLAWNNGQADCVYTVASVREAIAGTSCLMLPDPSTIAWEAVGGGNYRARAKPAPSRPAPQATRWRVRAGVPLHTGPLFGPGALEETTDLTLEQHGAATPHWTPLKIPDGAIRWALTSLLGKIG